jgi:uncharacterized protein (UPF0147 family)
VVDFDDAKFVVRTADGDITTTNLASQISDEYIDQVITSTTNDRVIRQRLMFPLEEPAPQQPRALLADPAGAETTALALRPREITDTVRREQELLRQIDEIDTAGQRQVAEVDETVQTLSGRKNDLQRRHELMDDIVDDPTVRGNNRRAITREIKEIDQQIESLNARRGEIESQSSASMRSAQRELAQFHKEFPETMESRRASRLFGESESGVLTGDIKPRITESKVYPKNKQGKIDPSAPTSIEYVSPITLRKTKINFDSNVERGLGATGYNQSINSYGFATTMKADEFLSVNPQRTNYENVPYIRKQIEEGNPIGPPFLIAKWNKTQKGWEITGHEGRGRALALKELSPDVDIPVHVKTDVAPRDMTPEMKSTNRIIPDKRSTNTTPHNLKEMIVYGEITTLKDIKPSRMVTHRTPNKGLTKYVQETAQQNIEQATATNTLKRLQDTSKAVKKAVDTQLELPFC